MTSSGKLFQTLAPAIGRARLPTVGRRKDGTSSKSALFNLWQCPNFFQNLRNSGFCTCAVQHTDKCSSIAKMSLAELLNVEVGTLWGS